ncbi:MAG TPA: Mur ligase domain-containing protein, partial [Alphaproteobacteria bacterium]
MTHYFLSGIGGSGMLPLALILKGQGHQVSGSDRSRDQGRTPEKFAKLEADGFCLFPQDGSGLMGEQADVTSPVCMTGEFNRPDFMVVSAAIEDTVPDVVAAKAAGIPIIKRAELLAQVFNTFDRRIAVGGTSGKTTTTGMIGFIAERAGLDPVVMCGGVMKNFGTTALTGKGKIFITESDESDGSIALYNPEIAVLNNVSVDHKELHELRTLFGDFVSKARVSIINRDNAEALALAGDNTQTFSVGDAKDIQYKANGIAATIDGHRLELSLPGIHNLSNALAAIAAASALGISVA